MNAVDRELEAIVRREADSVSPPDGAMERGWARLMAELPGDDGGPGDGGGPGGAAPPAVRPVPLAKAVPLLKAVPLAALLVVGALVSWGPGSEPALVVESLPIASEPAPLHEAPISIPYGPVSGVALPPAAPAAPATEAPEVAAPPRSTTARPRVGGEEDDFAGELKLLAAGQAAIQRGQLGEGLTLLRSHKQRFPRGHFAQERDALIAIARCEGGQARAREAGQKFLQTNSDSIHAERVRSACKLDESDR
jgi:hypothetical protein